LSKSALTVLNERITECRLCPRLVAHRELIALEKRRAYRSWEYWGRPVPSFGDPHARLLVVGLAPGAHGSNRTGRMFTGDRAGDFLYRALWEAGFANQPESLAREDGLKLRDAYITAPVRCAPPDNKPDRDEFLRCRPYFAREVELLTRVRVVVLLGSLALESYLALLVEQGRIPSRSAFLFAHGAEFASYEGGPRLVCSYHPSQQNTSTKRLTAAMLCSIFLRARASLEAL
jgi:uracil-DNA glycosylase